MFHIHKWEITKKSIASGTYTSVFFKNPWTEDLIIVIETCSKCGKTRAYYTDIYGNSKGILDVDYARILIEGRIK